MLTLDGLPDLCRPLRPDDAGRWAVLLAASEEVDRRGEHYDAADCAEALADPALDLAADSLVVLDGDEAVAAQVLHLRAGASSPSTQRYLQTDTTVHPAHRGRGLGTALLEQARRRAAQLDARVVVRVAEDTADAVALVEGAGLVPVRWWSELERDLAAPVAAVPLPAGLAFAPLGPRYEPARWDTERWDERLRAAHNAAFADHWGSSPVSAQAWAYGRTGTRNFRPGCSVAAVDPAGNVAGYVLAYEYEADTARTGVRELYVATVGTVREWRGRGVAGALLAHVLAAAVAEGYARSSLVVDSQNATGALGVYHRAGYALHRREVSYSEP